MTLAGIKIGADPLGGASVAYWGAMFATEKEREELPLRLRAVGYNAVRFHHFETLRYAPVY